VAAKDGYLLSNPSRYDTLVVVPDDHHDVIIKADIPGVWAFHPHRLAHAASPDGMFGLVTARIAADPSRAKAEPDSRRGREEGRS